MIMSIGAGEKRVVIKNDALAVATAMSVSLAYDHRVSRGALRRPARILLQADRP